MLRNNDLTMEKFVPVDQIKIGVAKTELLKTSFYRVHDLRSSRGGHGEKIKTKKNKNSLKFVNMKCAKCILLF